MPARGQRRFSLLLVPLCAQSFAVDFAGFSVRCASSFCPIASPARVVQSPCPSVWALQLRCETHGFGEGAARSPGWQPQALCRRQCEARRAVIALFCIAK